MYFVSSRNGVGMQGQRRSEEDNRGGTSEERCNVLVPSWQLDESVAILKSLLWVCWA
jgi:hypothetical protein